MFPFNLLPSIHSQGKINSLTAQPINQPKTNNQLMRAIKAEVGEDVLRFIMEHVALLKHQETVLFATNNVNLYEHVNFNNIRTIVNFQEVNKHQKINSFFRAINTLLPDAGIYIGCVETYDIRRAKMERKFGRTLTKVLWGVDFVFNRIMPRLSLTKKLYYYITKNKYRVLSLAETLGRLVYNGFEIIEYKQFNNKIYFAVMKTREPRHDNNVSNGPFFPMRRIGRDGKIIKVYKLRTMHPYSEFLQEFVLKLNGYNELGKPADDFRLTGWGKFFRKLWLDEIPQILNVLKGELSIVGVRPLSQTRFNQFPDDLKRERIKYNPGCIPPYVALCMPDARGNIEAERIYLNEMSKNKTVTNVKYFCMAVFNILTNKIHSA